MRASPTETTRITGSDDKPTDTGLATPEPSNPSSCDEREPTLLTPLVPMFALVIGINDYPNSQFGKLRGAVADAKAIKDYLEEVIRVPGDHIRTLLNGEATRDAILKGFEALRDDQRIHGGDPIFIYYAGHGSEIDPPPAWRIGGKIQCLVPHDCQPGYIHPIPDRTVGALIEDIAKLKGDNITVVFDCCYSASGTRDEDKKYVPRSVALDHSVPDDLDTRIWGGRAGSIPQSLIYHGIRSHILLAACGTEESSWECEEHGQWHGQFTTALLATLKDSTINGLTYTDVLRRIRLKRQSPHCVGFNQHRVLFNARVSAGRQVHYDIHRGLSVRGFEYVISAGLAHGVCHGAEFTVYSSQKQRKNVITVDGAAIIEDFQTKLTTPVHLASDSFAKLTRVGNVPFYVAPGGTLAALLEETRRTHATSFRLAEKAEGPRLEIAMDNDLAVFKILDRRVNALGLTALPYTVPPDKLAHILSAAAHYFWFLGLSNENRPIRNEDRVTVDFYPLITDYDDDGRLFYVPAEQGFCREDPDLNCSVIDFVVDPDEVYGIEIVNNTPWDLYLNAFLFNSSSLSIKSCYTQPESSAGTPEAPLRHKGAFQIGYGPQGTSAFQYSLEEGQNVDVSYLKVFFATRPIDLSEIEQTSPFLNAKVRDDSARKARLSLSKLTQAIGKPADVWFTIEIPVVQRRRKETQRVLMS